MKKGLPAEAGFTIIELLVVVAILGSLATFVIVRFTGAQDRANDTKRQAELRQYQNALEVYATRNNSIYPEETAEVEADSLCATLGLPGCPDDPDPTRHYMYESDVGGLRYVLWAEQKRTGEFFVLCSDGAVGTMPDTWTGPASPGACPL